MVLYLEKEGDCCDVVKVKFEGSDFTKLIGLVNDGLYVSTDDMKAFVELYGDDKGINFDLIAFSYKQGNNVESNTALASKMANGEGQLVDLTDNNGIPEGVQFDDGFVTNIEGKQQNVDVVKLSDITAHCLIDNNYAILGVHNYVDGGVAITQAQM